MTLRVIVLIGLMFAAPALTLLTAAADSKAIGRYNDWRVYTEGEGRSLVCFATVEANDKAPKAADHGEVVFYVAVWKSGASKGQVSLRVGYNLRTDIAPTAIVGRDRFAMVATGQEAFLKEDRDSTLIAALQKGQELRVEAASVKDARTAYHFSLKGSRDAIDKAKSLCK